MHGETEERERWMRIDAALDQLLALPIAEREARAAQLSAGDARLHRELLDLLQAEQQLGGFMESQDCAAQPLAQPTLAHGQRVGAWRVIRLVGRGGMGEVYLCERADGQFEQRAALKLIAAPLADRPEQFYAERRILAQLEHPGIARLLDGGVAEDGRPYMVVEFVEGLDFFGHCARQSLPPEPRLRLFAQVCEAVAYAHRHLVVHRDLKPANILVGTDGQPKLVDFGIAKLLDPARAAEVGRTLHATPSHAAPEQLQGGVTTTATDVYALGVILYELLAGAPPWPLERLPLALAVTRVLDDEPPPPSATAARGQARGAPPPLPARQLRGDLDGIVLKALRKRPEQRYASAAELLDDVQRHLRHEPVAARGYGAGYVVGRFVRRHRLAVASVAAVLLALVGGLAISLGFYLDARAARDRAEAAATTTQAVSDFLNRDLLGSADIAKRPTRDIGLRELLDKAAAEVDRRFAQQPDAAARVHESLGDSYFNLTVYEVARTQYARALALRRALPDVDPAAVLAVVAKHASASAYSFRNDEARALFDEAIAGYLRLGNARVLAELRTEYAGMLFGIGEMVLATDQMRRLLDSEAQRPTLDAEAHLNLWGHYASQLAWLGDYAAAEREQRAVLARQLSLLGPDRLPTALAQLSLGTILVHLARLDEAAAEIEPALLTVRRWVGPDDAYLATAENAAARLRQEQGRLREAESLLADTLRIRSQAFGAESSFTVWTQSQMAEILQGQGRLREALDLSERALPLAEKIDGPLNPWTTRQRLTQAAILRELGARPRAWKLLDAITPEAFAGLPARHPFLGMLRHEQGLLAQADGDFARARAALAEAQAIFEERYGAMHPRTQQVRTQRAAIAEGLPS